MGVVCIFSFFWVRQFSVHFRSYWLCVLLAPFRFFFKTNLPLLDRSPVACGRMFTMLSGRLPVHPVSLLSVRLIGRLSVRPVVRLPVRLVFLLHVRLLGRRSIRPIGRLSIRLLGRLSDRMLCLLSDFYLSRLQVCSRLFRRILGCPP